MPDLLGVTNPAPSHDSAYTHRTLPVSPGNVPIQNIIDPSRVGRSDGRNEQQDAKAGNGAARFDSNFQTFLQRLGGIGELTEMISRMLGRGGTMVSSGMNEGIAQEMGKFMEMLRMDKAEFLRFISTQLQAGTRFGGALFSLLRAAFQNADSESLRGDILQFLKRYGDYSSTAHVEGNLTRHLNQIARAIPARYGNELIEMLAKLENGMKAGDRAGNLKLLQGTILPFLADYVARTHDLGRARDLISLLTLDTARYESGSQTNLLQAFQLLKNHPALRDTLGLLDDASLLTLLKNSVFSEAAAEESFAARLAQLSSAALRGSGGPEAQSAFRELISAFLVNESVYMTVNHHIIPLEWNGKFMFSELWVDPDAEQRGQGAPEERVQRLLFKIDIESLGFLEFVLQCRGEVVEVQMQCPERLAQFTGLFERNISRILTDNGLQAKAVRVQKMEKPFTISGVFPKLFEGKDSVNVTI